MLDTQKTLYHQVWEMKMPSPTGLLVSFKKASNVVAEVKGGGDLGAQHFLHTVSGSGLVHGNYIADACICKGTKCYKNLLLAEASVNKVLHDLAEQWGKSPSFVESATCEHMVKDCVAHEPVFD